MQKDKIRDRLVELIFASLCRHIHKSCKLAENIADDLIADGVTVLRWIPVSERLPWTDGAPDQNADFFLVSFTGMLQECECRGFMFTATYNGDGKWSLPFKPYEDVTDGVTHWMPLPKEVE